MGFLAKVALVAVASIVGRSAAAPLTVHPGSAADVIVTANNTVNATVRADAATAPAVGSLPLSFVNNLPGAGVNAYVTGLDSNNQLVMLQPDGQFFYPTGTSSTPVAVTADIAIPVANYGSTSQITIPSYISAARIWFAQGSLQFFTIAGNNGPNLVEPSVDNPSDPSANINWGFVELTNTQGGGLYADVSYVDFVGLPLGMTMTATDGSTQTALGLTSTAVDSICTDLANQGASDGQPWGDLCVKNTAGQNLRVLAPIDYISINPSAFANYFTAYASQVWSTYTNSPLTIDTQTGSGDVNCQVSGGTLSCAGDNRGYAQPSASDIFGCNSGPFAIESGDNGVHSAVVPRLCAAFNRGTLLQSGGNVQPGPNADTYYTASPNNWFSAFVHKYEVDGKGYAFSYDDVAPDGGVNQAGVVVSTIPQVLEITIGGPSS